MNNAVWVIGATGLAYKMTGVVGFAAGKLAEVAFDKGVSYMFSKTDDSDTLSSDGDVSYLNLSEYERMTETEFKNTLKKESIQHILTELDVESRLKTTRALLMSIKEDNDFTDELIKVSLETVEDTCDKLKYILFEKIYKRIDTYNTSRSRLIFSLNLEKEMCELRLQLLLLVRRKHSLIESIQIKQALISKQSDNSTIDSEQEPSMSLDS